MATRLRETAGSLVVFSSLGRSEFEHVETHEIDEQGVLTIWMFPDDEGDLAPFATFPAGKWDLLRSPE